VPRQQRREECTKALKHANARQWLALPGRENAPAPVKELMRSVLDIIYYVNQNEFVWKSVDRNMDVTDFHQEMSEMKCEWIDRHDLPTLYSFLFFRPRMHK
jgi:hypothetical protein